MNTTYLILIPFCLLVACGQSSDGDITPNPPIDSEILPYKQSGILDSLRIAFIDYVITNKRDGKIDSVREVYSYDSQNRIKEVLHGGMLIPYHWSSLEHDRHNIKTVFKYQGDALEQVSIFAIPEDSLQAYIIFSYNHQGEIISQSHFSLDNRGIWEEYMIHLFEYDSLGRLSLARTKFGVGAKVFNTFTYVWEGHDIASDILVEHDLCECPYVEYAYEYDDKDNPFYFNDGQLSLGYTHHNYTQLEVIDRGFYHGTRGIFTRDLTYYPFGLPFTIRLDSYDQLIMQTLYYEPRE